MKKIICTILSIFLVFSFAGCGAEKVEDNTPLPQSSVTFFKTKNDADCSLIHHNDANILIDTGEKSDAKKILKQLEEQGIRRIDYVILSHFDKDHCGGLIKMIGEIEIGEILHPEYIKDSDETKKLFKTIDKEQIKHRSITKDHEIKAGDIDLSFFVAKKKEYAVKPSNNSSMVVMAKIDGKKFLYTGDCQEDRVQELLESNTNFDANVLKLMYHGREVANEERFIAKVNPEHTIITGDKDSKKTKKNIETLAHTLGNYRYTSDGNIVFEISNDNLIVK